MTVDALFKINAIADLQTDLYWYNKSYDVGHPRCRCSACGERILNPDNFEDPDSEEANDHFPVRMYRGERNIEEAILHWNCFEILETRGFDLVEGEDDDIDFDEQL